MSSSSSSSAAANAAAAAVMKRPLLAVSPPPPPQSIPLDDHGRERFAYTNTTNSTSTSDQSTTGGTGGGTPLPSEMTRSASGGLPSYGAAGSSPKLALSSTPAPIQHGSYTSVAATVDSADAPVASPSPTPRVVKEAWQRTAERAVRGFERRKKRTHRRTDWSCCTLTFPSEHQEKVFASVTNTNRMHALRRTPSRMAP